MLAPNAEQIEGAADVLNSLIKSDTPKSLLESERKELASFGNARAQTIGATGLSGDFMFGELYS